jgi:RNA recognition motif-containing protein
VQFLDEREMMVAIDDMNGKPNLIGAGKLRLTVYEQPQPTTKSKKKNNDTKKYDFVVKLSELPPDVDEEVLIQDLNQIQLSDYIIDVYVARKKLSEISSTDTRTNMAEDNQTNLVTLQSLFHNQKHFRSSPDIKINPPTNDGRVFALILFNDPRDVTTAMEMYQAPDDPDLLKFGLFKLRLVPLLDHSIELNSALTKAIPNKIKQTIDKIKNDPEFSNLRLIQKYAMKYKQDILRIEISGNNILQIYKARTVFDELMKGQIFKFNSPSWVCLVLLFIFS